MTTITGTVSPATDDLQRASDGFGQGDVLASPFGMAMVSATVAHGAPVTPSLIRGTTTEAAVAPGTPDRAVLDQLRPMMRAVVTSGTARAAAGQGEVFGKTGTAEYAGPDGSNRSHGWFTGYRGDLAFATLIVDGGSSGPAVQMTARFLSAFRAERPGGPAGRRRAGAVWGVLPWSSCIPAGSPPWRSWPTSSPSWCSPPSGG